LQIQVRVVALVARGSLPVTSSGKLRRSACRDAWLSNGLHVIARDEINMVPRKGAIATLVEKNQMEEVLCLLIADNLGIPADAIPANIPLTQLGLDSLGAIQVSGVLDAEFGMKHSIDFLLSGATLKDVTSKLVSLPDAVEPRRRVADAKPEQLREYAASLFQLRLWNVYHMTRRRGLLNIVRAVRFDGDLDTSRLIHAVQVVTNRHGSLRTTFSQGRTEVVAKEHLSVDVNIPIVDLRDLEPERRVRAVTDLARMMSHREVNLKRAPLWSACVLVLASREAQLIWSISHLLVDAISFDLLERELSALYADAPLLGDAGSYGLFAYEQRQKREQSDARHQLQYWSNRVDRISPISWPVLPQVHGVSTSIHRDVQLSKAWRLGFEGFCRHESITPFMAFFTALTAILWRYTGQLKFVVSVPVDCRPKNQLQSVGCFANRLPLVAEIDPRLTFREYLHRVREAISEVLENRHTALIDIETTLRSYRDASALNLLSQVLLEFRERDCLPDFGAVQATSVTLDPPDLPFDLVTAVELSDPVSLTFLFRSRYFNETACAWIVNAYHHVLQRMPESLSKTMSRLEMPPLPVSHSVQKALEIDIVANFVAEGIRESLTFWMNRINCPVRLEFTSFNQIIQYLLKSGHAELVSPNIAVILIRAEAYLMPREDISEVAARLNEIAEALLIASRRTPESRFIVLFCPASPVNHEDLRLETAERQFCELVQDERGIDVIPSRTLERCYQVNSYYDPYGDRLACMPYTRLSLTSFGTMVARRIECFRRRSKKVIVVDCDDTLWSGVGGEDGMQGITIDEHRVALQAFLKQQSESGRLLCICSKNDEEDVLDVLESHPDMLLRREHFAAWRINWLPKAENLRTLAEELNLALDGFICLDDSAAECAQLREQCPEVLTLELPTDVTQIPSFLYSVWEFDFARQTDTDRERAVLYRQHSTRVQSEKAATTMDDFLAGLNLCVCIEEVDECGVRRAAQLTERTNQFNLNGIRHSEDELMNFRNDPSCRLWLVRATDRFGDYGTIGLIGCRLGESMSATTFLLSCRALGKRIEYRMALWIAEIARSLEYEAVEFAFVETRKNAAVQQFLMTMEPKPVNRHLSVRADVVIRRCDAALMPFGRDRNGGYGFNGGPDRVDEGRITA
jgi:FkbH-like protein